MSREAMKLALEAWLDPWTQNNVTTDYDAYGKHGIPLYTAPPQPEQPNDFRPDWDAMAVMVEEQQRMAKRIEELEAQRKPLTDEQFNDLVMEHLGPHALTGGKMSVYDAFLKAVRATEAAHGIKENT